MSKTFKIGVIVGSLRKESFNRRVAKALVAAAPASLEAHFIEIGDLLLFNQDLEPTPPAPWVAFRDAVRGVDALLFVTPEYNRSVPAALKNAIDVGSRPYGQSVWSGKPAAVVSASPSAIGAFGANHHLRQSLVFLNMPTLQQPEAYLGHADKLVGADGKPASEDTAKYFGSIMGAFAALVEKHAK